MIELGSSGSKDQFLPPRTRVSPCVGPKLFPSGKRFHDWCGTGKLAPPARRGFRAERGQHYLMHSTDTIRVQGDLINDTLVLRLKAGATVREAMSATMTQSPDLQPYVDARWMDLFLSFMGLDMKSDQKLPRTCWTENTALKLRICLEKAAAYGSRKTGSEAEEAVSLGVEAKEESSPASLSSFQIIMRKAAAYGSRKRTCSETNEAVFLDEEAKEESSPASLSSFQIFVRKAAAYARKTGSETNEAVFLDEEAKEESSPASLSSFQIFVQVASSRTITVDVLPSDSVAALKHKIYDKEGVPAVEQRVIFGSKQLCDASTLASCGITKDASVQVQLGLRGGMPISSGQRGRVVHLGSYSGLSVTVEEVRTDGTVLVRKDASGDRLLLHPKHIALAPGPATAAGTTSAGAAYSGPPLFRAGPLSSSVPSPPAVAAAGGYATEDFEKENASLRERLLKLEEELARAKEARSDNLRHGTKDAPDEAAGGGLPPRQSEAKLLEATEHILDCGWEGLRKAPPISSEERDEIFKAAFSRIDMDGSGTISQEELEQELKDVPQSALAGSAKLRKLREKLKKAEAGVEVGLAEFAEVAEDLHRCRARTVCTLAGVSFGEAMEEALFRALGQGRKGAGVWHDEALHLHPLHALAALDPKARAQHLMPLAVQVLPEVVARLVRSVGAEEEYAVEQKEIPDTQGKFNNAMVLCTPELFRVGLEAVVGFPEFASAKKVLEAMWREHTEGEHALVKFTAWNHGEARETTPAEQMRMMLPEGPSGKIYQYDYSRKVKMCEDFEKHEMALKAGLSTAEVLALRLYTGPMFSCYNGFLRAIGSKVETLLPVVRAELALLRTKYEKARAEYQTRAAAVADAPAPTNPADPGPAPRPAAALQPPPHDTPPAAHALNPTSERLLAVWRGQPFCANIVSVERTVSVECKFRPAVVGYKLGCRAGQKAYYELTLKKKTEGLRVGFVSAAFERRLAAKEEDYALGADSESWGVGEDSTVWHGGASQEYGAAWKEGDVIGVACDLVAQQVLVSVNGDFAPPNGVAFQLDAHAPAPQQLFAAFSHSGYYKCKVEFNFGDGAAVFAHAPPSADFVPLMRAAGAATPADVTRMVRASDLRHPLWPRASAACPASDTNTDARHPVAAAASALALAFDAKLISAPSASALMENVVAGKKVLPASLREVAHVLLLAWHAGARAHHPNAKVVSKEEANGIFMAVAHGRAKKEPAGLGFVAREMVPLLRMARRDKVLDLNDCTAMLRDVLEGAVAGEEAVAGALAAWDARLQSREDGAVEEALRRATAELGAFPYPTTAHAINSALIKVSRVTPLPVGGKVFRGVAGMLPSERLLQPNEFGACVGDELGFMSTSTDKEQALGYMDASKRHKQMLEIEVGHVDRGAFIDWLSLFPGEKEMLFPPNSSLEVAGAVRHEQSHKGLVLIWPLRLNLNLSGRTLEDFQAMRKQLLLEAAANTLNDVRVLLAQQHGRPEVQGRRDPWGESVDRMLRSIERQCVEEVEGMKKRPQEYYNDDARYKLAYEELTELKELAEGVVDVWLSDGVRTAAGASWLTLKGAKQTRIRLTHEELAWCKQEPLLGKAGRAAGLALKLCKMKRLLAVEIEERDSAGFSPLMRWANDGYPLAVSLLLDAGADRAAATSSGETALHLALRAKYFAIAKDLAEHGAPAAAQNKDGESPLHLTEGDVGMMAVLLEATSDIDVRTSTGWTPLMKACTKFHLEVAALLLEKGAEVDAKDNNGWTPLMKACSQPYVPRPYVPGEEEPLPWLELVALLLEKGAEIDAKDNNGCTPLMHAEGASSSNYLKLIAFLLEKGAEIEAKDNDGWTPLIKACWFGRLELVALLLEKGAEIEAKANDGGTALMWTCHAGRLEVAALLLEKGAEIEAKDNDGGTPLMYTITTITDEGVGHPLEVAALLLEKGAEVEAKANDGWTALMKACAGGSTELAVKMLVASKRHILGPSEGWRAAHYAVYGGAEELAARLVGEEEGEASSSAVEARLQAVRDDVLAYREAQPLELFAAAPSLSAMINTVDRTVTFSEFRTVRFKHGCAGDKKAFYELTIKEPPGCPQFGFATSRLNAHELPVGHGVGDNDKSWGVDGDRCKKWSSGNEEEYAATWSAGDVIGLAWDGAKRQILVSVNGDFAPPNGVVFELDPDAAAADMHPAFSAEGGVVEYNFGEEGREFAHKPPAADFVGFGRLEQRSE